MNYLFVPNDATNIIIKHIYLLIMNLNDKLLLNKIKKIKLITII